MEKDFKNYFKFPLKFDEWSVYIWTADQQMAAMFPWDRSVDEKMFETVVSVINGDIKAEEVPFLNGKEFEYRGTSGDAIVYDKTSEKTFIIIRGWGRLVAPGCCNLKPADAARVQDDFGNYIANKLNNN